MALQRLLYTGIQIQRHTLLVSERSLVTATVASHGLDSSHSSYINDVPTLYRKMLHAAKDLQDYNIRSYALRRVRIGFGDNKNVKDENKIKELIEKANEQLDVLERQAAISKMYAKHASVMEKIRK